jgi:hypothetical protein
MNPARVSGALCHQACRVWRRTCLRQATQLSCNPLGIIAGLAVMVGTVELWSHGRDAWTWVFVLGVCVAIVMVTLAIVRLLTPMIVVSSPRHHKRCATGDPLVPVRLLQPELPSLQGAAQDLGADALAKVSADDTVFALHPDSTGRPQEREHIRESA